MVSSWSVSLFPLFHLNQEWEAYVSDSDSDGEDRGSWSDMLSPEERERQRREREESRRVLSELKAVLGFRASEGERMKRKQLLFNDQGLHGPMSSFFCDNSQMRTLEFDCWGLIVNILELNLWQESVCNWVELFWWSLQKQQISVGKYSYFIHVKKQVIKLIQRKKF